MPAAGATQALRLAAHVGQNISPHERQKTEESRARERHEMSKCMKALWPLLLLSLTVNCFRNSFENNLKNAIQINYGSKINIADISDFQWDSLTVLGPYNHIDSLFPQLKQSIRDRIKHNDDICLLVFENSGEIAFTQFFGRNKGDFAYRLNYYKLSNDNAVFLVEKDQNGWVYLSRITKNTVPCVYATEDNDPYVAEIQPRGNCGYIDNGRLIICDTSLSKLTFTTEGLSSLLTNTFGWVFVRRNGEAIQTVTFDNGPDIISEGLLRYIDEGKVGFIDKYGEIKIRAAYTFAFPFQRDLSMVCNDCIKKQDGEHSIMVEGTWGYIDKNGNEVVPVKFSQKEAETKIRELKRQQ